MERYGIGLQSFRSIREGGYVYVDKTDFIRVLLEGSKYYFLARPRRFGKSLFLSTLENFFLGRRDLFRGLAIDSYDGWDWQPHAVVRIDLNGADYANSEVALAERLHATLLNYETAFDLPARFDSPAERLRDLITRAADKYGRGVVVLVDEYEKPVLDTIADSRRSEEVRETLRGFYSVLKSVEESLAMVFITGVTKFGKMSIFSGFNNLQDISMDMRFGAICGITEPELIANFRDGIEGLAEAEEVGFDEAVAVLKKNYDGYHFSRNCPDLYNPFSILSAMSRREIGPYWFMTGTPTLLATLLMEKRYDLQSLDGVMATEKELMDVQAGLDNPVALFYQTGYLTLKGYDRESRTYTLGFPNQEVESAFYEYLIPFYMNARENKSDSLLTDFVKGITTGDTVRAIEVLEAYSAGINYDLVPKAEVERHFQNMVYAFSRMVLPYAVSVKTEDHTSDGRIDLLIQTSKYIYVIEMKCNKSAAEALGQIREKGYGLQFKTDPRQVIFVGMNFSTEKRRLDGYEIELQADNG